MFNKRNGNNNRHFIEWWKKAKRLSTNFWDLMSKLKFLNISYFSRYIPLKNNFFIQLAFEMSIDWNYWYIGEKKSYKKKLIHIDTAEIFPKISYFFKNFKHIFKHFKNIFINRSLHIVIDKAFSSNNILNLIF